MADKYKRIANKIFKVALATFGCIGAVGTMLLFFGAGTIANNWIQIPEAELTLVALSPAIFFVSISSVFRGYFNGRRSLKTTARAQTLEQIFKTILTIVVVEIVAFATSTSTEMMAAGANIATTLATFSSFVYLFIYYRIKRKEIGNEIQSSTNYKYENVKTIIKKILMVSIPLTLSSIMTSFNKNIDSFTVKRILSTYLPAELAIEKYGILTDEELKAAFWEKVKEVNKKVATYKYIKDMILTEEPLIRTTTNKVKRFEEIKKILGK